MVGFQIADIQNMHNVGFVCWKRLLGDTQPILRVLLFRRLRKCNRYCQSRILGAVPAGHRADQQEL
jgi:hypothetical protein